MRTAPPAARVQQEFDSWVDAAAPEARDEISRRKREARRFTAGARRRRWIVLAAGVLTLFVVTPMLLAMSPLFAVRTFAFSGATPAVERALQARLSSVIGTPIALVDEAAIGRDIAGVVAVQRYSVAELPPDTIAVHVVLRQPIGQVASNGGYQVVDAAGVALRTADARVEGLPLITTAGGTGSAAFAAAGTVLAGLPATLLARTRSASAASASDVRLTLTNGMRVVWGTSGDGTAKAAALQAALVRAAKGAKVIDVSAPGIVAIR